MKLEKAISGNDNKCHTMAGSLVSISAILMANILVLLQNKIEVVYPVYVLI